MHARLPRQEWLVLPIAMNRSCADRPRSRSGCQRRFKLRTL